MEKYIIWSNHNLDYEDWREEMEEQYPDMSDYDRLMAMYETNDMYLDDERMNLGHIKLDKPILVIADLGLWNGRHQAYAEIRSGRIADCLVVRDEDEFYVDEHGEFCCEQYHHDGTNHLIYRGWKPSASEDDMVMLKDLLYDGTATQADIDAYTYPLGDLIGEVYGWNTKASA